MPKFNLYPRPLPDQPDGADTRVEVGYGPLHGVQIATTKLQPGADRNRDFIDGSGTVADPPRRAWDGWYISLERDQINELIRTLRDARDKAFGRDE
jgi:fermentation-respiration switch protein FrsA (DUF1100 family)